MLLCSTSMRKRRKRPFAISPLRFHRRICLGVLMFTTLALARERLLSTDIGQGVAIPVARCPGLTRPLMVLGRSAEGILFSTHSIEPARLIFLLVTPAERPNVQVFLLAQLTRAVGSEFIRERLYREPSAQELVEIIAAADPEGRKDKQSGTK